MFETLKIQSYKGVYEVHFSEEIAYPLAGLAQRPHYIIDAKVAQIYEKPLRSMINSDSSLIIEATEAAKNLDQFPPYVEHLVRCKLRRGDVLVAIGGGVIQDITCFLAATLLRGVDWVFFPTTLLAQADSCIGSKSSINAGSAKNILGTFTPPKAIFVNSAYLDSLTSTELMSGMGEMLKVHIINGPQSFQWLADQYDAVFGDRSLMLKVIQSSLEIKKRFIEDDEFDAGIRNILNYGHSFGHAMEAATDYLIPHGIAVSLGMDMANYLSMKMDDLSEADFQMMHAVLAKNYLGYQATVIPMQPFLLAIAKDKKNTASHLTLITPGRDGIPRKIERLHDAAFANICAEFLQLIKSS